MDDLRARLVAAVERGLAFEQADPDSVPIETVNAVIAVVQPTLDRLNTEVEDWRNAAYKHAKELADAISACRSTATLLRSTADRVEAGPASDPLLLRMAARDLDNIAKETPS